MTPPLQGAGHAARQTRAGHEDGTGRCLCREVLECGAPAPLWRRGDEATA
jgi:hypothetical protein